MRSRSTIEFIGLWETLNNPGFKPIEFERFKTEADSNYFVLSPQRWIEATYLVFETGRGEAVEETRRGDAARHVSTWSRADTIGEIVSRRVGFQKKTRKTPDVEIEKAIKIKEGYYADKRSQN